MTSDGKVVTLRLVDAPAPVAAPEQEPTPQTVLRQSEARGLTSVMVIGYTPEGTMWVSSSGTVTRQSALWLLESAKMPIVFGDDDE